MIAAESAAKKHHAVMTVVSLFIYIYRLLASRNAYASRPSLS